MNHILTGATRRATRTRKIIRGTAEKPRLSVYRSNQHVYAQLIDDAAHKTILAVAETSTEKMTKTERAHALGNSLAKKALDAKIKTVVFDKGSYAYHGRVKAIAEGAREGGLIF